MIFKLVELSLTVKINDDSDNHKQKTLILVLPEIKIASESVLGTKDKLGLETLGNDTK